MYVCARACVRTCVRMPGAFKRVHVPVCKAFYCVRACSNKYVIEYMQWRRGHRRRLPSCRRTVSSSRTQLLSVCSFYHGSSNTPKLTSAQKSRHETRSSINTLQQQIRLLMQLDTPLRTRLSNYNGLSPHQRMHQGSLLCIRAAAIFTRFSGLQLSQ